MNKTVTKQSGIFREVEKLKALNCSHSQLHVTAINITNCTCSCFTDAPPNVSKNVLAQIEICLAVSLRRAEEQTTRPETPSRPVVFRPIMGRRMDLLKLKVGKMWQCDKSDTVCDTDAPPPTPDGSHVSVSHQRTNGVLLKMTRPPFVRVQSCLLDIHYICRLKPASLL